MLFEGRASNWALTKLEIENLGIEVSIFFIMVIIVIFGTIIMKMFIIDIVIIIMRNFIMIIIRGLSSATTSRWFRATVTGSLHPRASPGAASKQVISSVILVFII